MKTATPVKMAGCIIMDAEGDVLVMHRKTARATHWELPGGKIELGETAEEAAVRELGEELGVDVKLTRKVGERVCDEVDYSLHFEWFLAEITAGEPRLLEPVFDKFGFLSPITLTRRYDELSPGLKSFLEAVAYGKIDLAI